MFGNGKFEDTFGELTLFHSLFSNGVNNTPEEQRKRQMEITKLQEAQKKETS